MTVRNYYLDDEIYEYILQNSFRDLPILKKLRNKTRKMPGGNMQISPDQGQLMSFLIKITEAKKIIEVGTYTGYSSLVMALSIPDDGKIICCDIDEVFTSVAKKFWDEAGVSKKIKLFLGPAEETLLKLLVSGDEGKYDMAFIDADKINYKIYYENCLNLLRSGGLMIIDNVLWSGKTVDPNNKDVNTISIRELNQKIFHDKRVDLSMLPVGDGLTLVRKK